MTFVVLPSKILSKAMPQPRDAVCSFPLKSLRITEFKKPTLQSVELCILMNSWS